MTNALILGTQLKKQCIDSEIILAATNNLSLGYEAGILDDKLFGLQYPIPFSCREKIGRKFEEWDGYIKRIYNYGSHTEVYLESRSSITFIIGNYVNGNFISIPSLKIGCDLSFEYCDYFWNNEHLAMLINKVDAATIAKALFVLNKLDLIVSGLPLTNN